MDIVEYQPMDKQIMVTHWKHKSKNYLKWEQTKIISDTFTGTTTDRPNLNKLLSDLQTGDKLIVTKLDRIARTVMQGIELINSLLERGVIVEILNIGTMSNTSSGKLIRNIFLAFAEFERDMIVERTQEGKARARQNPNYKEGRPKKYGLQQIEHALELKKTKSYREVEALVGISKSTLIRAMRKRKQDNKHY